ncbi:MAG: hypothetical protein WBW31_12655 [Candidatus Sulfotelmatobacter sp.]
MERIIFATPNSWLEQDLDPEEPMALTCTKRPVWQGRASVLEVD